MSLPLSRDFDAVDAGPLPHTTTNAIQDAIVGGTHGSITKHIEITGATRAQSAWALDSSTGWWELAATLANDELAFTLPLGIGDRLTALSYYCRDVAPGASGDGLRGSIIVRDPLLDWAIDSTPETNIDSALDGTSQKVSVTLGTPHTVVADKPLELDLFVNPAGDLAGGNIQLYPLLALTFDRP